MNRILLSAIAVSGALASQGAAAQSTATDNMAVSASVSSVCSVDASAMAFGEVALSGATDSTSTITVNCTGGGAYTVGLGNGLNNVAAQRKLKSGVNLLNYDLFKEEARATRWGDAGAGLVSGTGNAADQILTAPRQATTRPAPAAAH